MLRLLFLTLALVAVTWAACDDDSWCARRGYTFPCIPSFQCPVNATKFAEYLRQGRTKLQMREACAELGLRPITARGLAKVTDAFRTMGLLIYYALHSHPDTELCMGYVGSEPLNVVLIVIWTPIGMAGVYWQWRKQRLAIDKKKHE